MISIRDWMLTSHKHNGFFKYSCIEQNRALNTIYFLKPKATSLYILIFGINFYNIKNIYILVISDAFDWCFSIYSIQIMLTDYEQNLRLSITYFSRYINNGIRFYRYSTSFRTLDSLSRSSFTPLSPTLV